ncbi:MATE family efflux transporter [uncultured Ruthenibacterium sp.]|uniref:MATE family efflux transporter n=1 Tax=uncultured Ruthenibacterium sp. TaxID=1905347 RepID=UPI00349E6F53
MNTTKLDYSVSALVRMSWPVFIELLLQLLVGNMDQVQLSHFNETAVAAVGNANTVITVVQLTFTVISMAATILVTQYRGAGRMEIVGQIYTLSLCVNGILAAALAGCLLAFTEPLLGLMQVPAELLGEAAIYLRITALALPFQALMLTFSAFLRAGAHMKIIMWITGLVNVCNIVGNAVLINGWGPFPRLGAAGAALSSSIFRAVGMLLMAFAFFRVVQGARVSFSDLNPMPWSLLRRLLAIGLPAGGESLSYNLSQASCLVFVNLMGTYVVTTRMYTAMFANCIYMLVMAVAQAGQVLVGYLVGARDMDGTHKCTMRVLKLSCPITVGLAAVVALAGGSLFGLFTVDERVIALGQQVLIVEVLLEVGRSVNIVLVRHLQAAGDVRFPVVLGIVCQWLIGVGLGWLLGVYLGWGLIGLWVAFAADENIRAVVLFGRWMSGKWRTMKTI